MQLDKINSLFPKVLIVGKLYTFTSWSSTDHCYHTTSAAVCIESCDLSKQMELFNDISDIQDTPEDYNNTNWNTCETFVGFLIREKYLLPIELEEISLAGKEFEGPVGLERIAADYANYKTKYKNKTVMGAMQTDAQATIVTKRKG